MFNLACCRRKKNKTTHENVLEKRTWTHSTDRVAVPDAPAAEPSAQNHTGRTPWRYRLFGRPLTKEREEKSSLMCKIIKCCTGKCRVTPASGDEEEKTTSYEPQRSPVKATDEAPFAPYRVDEVEEFKAPVEEEDKKPEKKKKKEKDVNRMQDEQAPSSSSTTTHPVSHSDATQAISSQSITAKQQWLGFPNPTQICYMNSSLQSLITLANFTRAVSCQKEVWSSVPEAELIRRFMDVVQCHRSKESSVKLKALNKFKMALSIQAPEFRDHRQKDAHEFLTTVMDQFRSLSPMLQIVAGSVGMSYRCPVEDHLVFRMHNTRTCKSCGSRSTREEDFTNLSLYLLPGASVQEMLQNYLMETELDFRCVCGANKSGQQSSFETLPKVLMLQVKRFCFTSLLQMRKLREPVNISRKLTVTSSQTDSSYSLVSIISHLGSRANMGHYISDGIYPDATLDDPDDRWMTYNDAMVTQTTGASVCERRQRDAYILFYQRRAEVKGEVQDGRCRGLEKEDVPRPLGGGVYPREPGSSRGFFLPKEVFPRHCRLYI